MLGAGGRTQRGHERTFWNDGDVPYLDLGYSYRDNIYIYIY